jgi:hypothetical protein
MAQWVTSLKYLQNKKIMVSPSPHNIVYYRYLQYPSIAIIVNHNCQNLETFVIYPNPTMYIIITQGRSHAAR